MVTLSPEYKAMLDGIKDLSEQLLTQQMIIEQMHPEHTANKDCIICGLLERPIVEVEDELGSEGDDDDGEQ